MEIASPLSFQRASRASAKRPFACSSSLVDPAVAAETADDYGIRSMDHVESYEGNGQPSYKRRRRGSNEAMEASGESSFPSLSSLPSSQMPSPFSASQPGLMPSLASRHASRVGHWNKRSRSERTQADTASWNQCNARKQIASDLQRVVDQQAAEISRLKSEKAVIEKSLVDTKASLEKATSENRILKKAVTIQQERQNQATSEMEAVRRYRLEAEDRIRKLEHMNMTLRYQLQARDAGAVNDFMGFNPRPPDVC